MQGSKIVRNGLAIVLVLGMTIPLSGFAKTAVDESAASIQPASSKSTSTDTFSENPGVELPDKVATSIPDDAQFVAKDYVQTTDGKLLSAENGQQITDPELVGTKDEPADPLAKSDGQKFIPQEVSTVRSEISEKNSDGTSGEKEQSDTSDSGVAGSMARYVEKPSASESAREHPATAAALQNNSYGAYWGTYKGTQAFFEKSGKLFVQQAKGVIDVSEWQSDINWDAVKASGVEGAIIRIGYSKSSVDKKAARNISECKRLGIPFGIYMYSYASNAAEGTAEGEGTVSRLKNMGVIASDLSYPVYYDLENWVSGGSYASTNPGTWDGIVNSWWSVMQSAGFDGRLGVYSYTYFLNTALNTSNIHSKTSWVAQYGPCMQFSAFGSKARGWQYSSTGSVSGISGDVDLNALGNAKIDLKDDFASSVRVSDVVEGDYFLGSAFADRYVGIESGSLSDLARVVVGSPSNGQEQVFHVSPVGGGKYSIVSKKSGKALDVEAASKVNGTRIIQFAANGGENQKWEFYRNSAGYMYIVSAFAGSANKVLDVTAAKSDPGTPLELWDVNGGSQQQFRLMQSTGFSGEYSVVSDFANGNRLDVSKASPLAGATVDVWTSTGGGNQIFSVVSKGNGLFALKAKHSGMVLDIEGMSPLDGASVIQYGWSGGLNQLWYFQRDASGKYSIISALSNKALDIYGMDQRAGAHVITYRQNGQANQKWTISHTQASGGESRQEAVSLSASYGVRVSDVVEGDYFLGSAFADRYVGIESGSLSDLARVVVGSPSNGQEQVFHVTPVGGGKYSIVSKKSGKALDVEAASKVNGARIIQFAANGGENQKWEFYRNSAGYMYIVSAFAGSANKVLDVTAAKSDPGTPLELWDVNGGSQQQFRLMQSTGFSGEYSVVSDFANGNRLDVSKASPLAGATVDVWTSTGGGNQVFSVVSKGNGLFALKAKHSGMVLDIEGMSPLDGASVIQYGWSGGLNQLWYFQRDASGKYAIISALSNKALDIYGMDQRAGAHVITYRQNGQANQKWTITHTQESK